MSAQHTPGRLVAEELDPDADYDFVIRQVDGDPYPITVAEDISEANARRLVACWNACEGIDTHKLEGKTIAEYVASEAYVTGLATGADGVNLGLSGLACQMLASSFAGQFKGTGAINYLELRMHHAEIGHFVVNIQRQSGETPCQQLAAARAQRDELLAVLHMALPALETMRKQWPRSPLDDSMDVVEVVRAAIAKVEGGAA